MTELNRREILKLASTGAVLCSSGAMVNAATDSDSWKMGVLADLHYGLAPDALARLSAFMEDVDQVSPDCVLQLGDFNFGVGDAKSCQREWEQFAGPRHHVLGNHDMDKAAKEPVMEAWGMPARYYSFDHRDWHFVILDRNHVRAEGRFIPYATANFYVDGKLRGFADPAQLEWLAADLAKTELPTVVFVHQGLGMDPQLVEGTARGMVEAVLRDANRETPGKVRACFCGHHHIDRYNLRDGLHYLWINSASYYWVGAQYDRMAFYADPLYTFLTFHADGTIEVAGRKSSWTKPSPAERGYPEAERLTPFIRERRLTGVASSE